MLRRFRACLEEDMTTAELADFAELDAEYEAEMDILFAEQLAEDGIMVEAMLAAMDGRSVEGDGAGSH